jgi:hypothetical protein
VPNTVRMLHTLAGLGDSDGDRVVVGVSVAVAEGEMRPERQASGSHRTARTCAAREEGGGGVLVWRKLHPTAHAWRGWC